MLRLPVFRLYRPTTVEEATRILADLGPEAVPVAGGTDLYPKMKRRQIVPKFLVSLRGIPALRGIEGDPNRGLVLRAGCTLAEVARHPAVRAGYQALAQAVAACSNPILHRMGTLGGNLCLDTRCSYYDQSELWREALGWCMKAPGKADPSTVPCRVAPGGNRCWAVCASDGAPALIALGARVRLVGPSGDRIVPLERFYRDDGIRFLEKTGEEILCEVLLPPADGLRSAYRKVRRRGVLDFAALGVAVSLGLDEGGMVQDCRIVLGGVASCPLVLEEAGALVVGKRVTAEVLEKVAEAVYRAVHPLDNTDFTISYRRRMAPVYVTRTVAELTQSEGEGCYGTRS